MQPDTTMFRRLELNPVWTCLAAALATGALASVLLGVIVLALEHAAG